MNNILLMEASVDKTVKNIGGVAGESLGETSVLKDALGLGVLLLLIASTQMASFLFGA